MQKSKHETTNFGIAALVLLSVTGGLMAVLARYLGNGLGVYEQWYLRFGIAFIASIAIFYRQISLKNIFSLPLKEWSLLIFRVIVGQVIGLGLFTLASEKAEPGIVTFMQVMPVIAILGVVVLHEKITWSKSLITLLSFIGASLVVVNSIHDLSGINEGALLSLLSAFFYSLMLVTRKWHSDKLNNHELTVAFLGLSAILTYFLSVVLYHRWTIPKAHWNTQFTLVIIAAGLLSVLINYLINYSFNKVSAIVAGNILTLEILFGPFFGYIFYNETFTSRDVLGGAVILISVLLMNQVVSKEQNITRPIVAVPD